MLCVTWTTASPRFSNRTWTRRPAALHSLPSTAPRLRSSRMTPGATHTLFTPEESSAAGGSHHSARAAQQGLSQQPCPGTQRRQRVSSRAPPTASQEEAICAQLGKGHLVGQTRDVQPHRGQGAPSGEITVDVHPGTGEGQMPAGQPGTETQLPHASGAQLAQTSAADPVHTCSHLTALAILRGQRPSSSRRHTHTCPLQVSGPPRPSHRQA